MADTASHAAANTAVAKLGFDEDQIILELGYDDDVDEALRTQIEEVVDGELEDEEYGDVVDGVLLWWRDDDGDLTGTTVVATVTGGEYAASGMSGGGMPGRLKS